MKEFLIKDDAAFKLRVQVKPCVVPKDLNAVYFVQEVLGEDEEIVHSSTYEFFLTNEEIAKLCEGLKNE
jgi:hypothetical protein